MKRTWWASARGQWRARWRAALAIGFMPRLLGGLLLLNVLMVALATWSLYDSRLKYQEGAVTQTQNLSRMLDHDFTVFLRSVDLTLQASSTDLERLLGGETPSAQAINAYLARQLFQTPDLDGLRVADAQGYLRYGTGVNPATPLSVADRDYFVRLRQRPGVGLVLGEPVRGRVSGKWVLILARSIQDAQGQFVGVVLGSVPLTRFTRAFSALSLGEGGTFSLIDSRRRILTRYPELPGSEPLMSLKFGPEALMREGAREGSYEAVSTLDGVQRVSAYRRVQGMPLHVVVGLSTQEYLASWRQEVMQVSALVLLFMGVTLVLSWVIYRAWHRQAEAVASLRELNRSLEQERRLNQTIIQSSPFAIYTRNRQGIVTAWNLAAEKLFGWRAAEIIGKPLLSVPQSKTSETEALRERVLSGESLIQFEVQRQRRDGSLFDLSTTLAPLRDDSGAIHGYLAIATDITARKQAERQIEFLAYRDVLTGLPNRLLLNDRFTQALAQADRHTTHVALLFIDLDNFKTINDSLGHAVGDALLKEIATRLALCMRDTDTISRQGGDEFLVVLPDLGGAEAVTPVLAKIRERLQLPFEFDGHELSTSASIGIAMYPDDGRDFETLLKKADTAMYQAKDAGRNGYRFFDERMNDQAVENLSLKTGLRRALSRNEFELYYQPQIDLASGRVVAAEALLRWHHPQHGLVAPGRFIAAAEDNGLIVPIGEWVIQQACRQGVTWQRAGLPPLSLAVNLSAVEFIRGDVESKVVQALKDSGLDPHCLELELTESILIHNTEQVLATVQRLKQLGVKLSVDDFGTGYSSLSYLKRFDVDRLKIDQSFVRDLVHDQDDAAIVRAIIQMAHSLNLRTVAEGVEDAETLERLRQLGCHEVQGYFLAKPMKAIHFEAFVRAQSEVPPATRGDWTI